MGQAKRRGSYEARVKQATKGSSEAEKFIHDTDEMIMLDVAIDNVFSTQLGITHTKKQIFPMKNTEKNIQISVADHRENGFTGTDNQILLSAWGVITGQCMAAAHEKGMEFFTSKPFLAYITQSVAYVVDKIGGPVKTIKIHLHGTPNPLGVGDPYVCNWAPDSQIQLLAKDGRVIETMDYATLRSGKSDAEVLHSNADIMSKWVERNEQPA